MDEQKKQDNQNKFTEKEKQRLELYERITEDYEQKGYVRENVTMTAKKANLIGFLWCLLFMFIFGGWYILRNGFDHNRSITASIVTLVLLLLSFVVHELIHGLAWGILAPNHFKYVEFGILRSSFTPYCTCKEPAEKWKYIIALIMPFLILGVIPCLAAIFCSAWYGLFFGLIAILGAGGDLSIIVKMLCYKTDSKHVIFMDHPVEIGFIVFKK